MSRSVRDCSPSWPVASSDHIAVVEVRIRHPMPSMARIVTHGLTTARAPTHWHQASTLQPASARASLSAQPRASYRLDSHWT